MQDPLIDELDLRLIHALQTRARIPWTTLAGILRVDAATLMRRWRRLVDHGYVYVTALIPLPASKLALAFVEILREAATNGICHGHADTIEVTMSETGLRIADNGCGAPDVGGAGGLASAAFTSPTGGAAPTSTTAIGFGSVATPANPARCWP